MATTDMADIATEITIEENSDGTAAATVTAEVIAAASDGTFGSAVVANAGSTSALAMATVEAVAAAAINDEEDNEVNDGSNGGDDEDDDDDDDDGLAGAGIVLIILAVIILAVIALAVGVYLIFRKEGFCFNTGSKAEAAAGSAEYDVPGGIEIADVAVDAEPGAEYDVSVDAGAKFEIGFNEDLTIKQINPGSQFEGKVNVGDQLIKVNNHVIEPPAAGPASGGQYTPDELAEITKKYFTGTSMRRATVGGSSIAKYTFKKTEASDAVASA